MTLRKAVGTVPVCVSETALLVFPAVQAGRPAVAVLQIADALVVTELKNGTGCEVLQFWAAFTASVCVPPT